MKAITLHQPWASLVAFGEKKIETRSWSTRYRGELLIHAAQRINPECKQLVAFDPAFRYALAEHGINSWTDLPTGKILCIVKLTHIAPTEQYAWSNKEEMFGDFRPGRYAWIFADDIVVFDEPIPAKGNRRLWSYTSLKEKK